jgi:hypothetical protein
MAANEWMVGQQQKAEGVGQATLLCQVCLMLFGV